MLEFDRHNGMRAGSPEATLLRPPDTDELLRLGGYRVYPVRKVVVLNSDPRARRPDVPIEAQPVGFGGYGLVMSGTYRAMKPGVIGPVPAGPVMRHGVLDTPGLPVSEGRGAVAVLEDGSVVVGRCDGTDANELQATFSDGEHPVTDLVGGGALLVEGGKPVSERDLITRQYFAGRVGGFASPSMAHDFHTVFGIHSGHAFAIVALNRCGRDIQEHLASVGFSAVVKFERGNGFFFRDDETCVPGRNPVGFGVTVRRMM